MKNEHAVTILPENPAIQVNTKDTIIKKTDSSHYGFFKKAAIVTGATAATGAVLALPIFTSIVAKSAIPFFSILALELVCILPPPCLYYRNNSCYLNDVEKDEKQPLLNSPTTSV